MNRLIVWFNSIIKKHRALKRWQRIVTVMAAVITFVTTYALILPAITVEKDNAENVAGMYLESVEGQENMLEDDALEPVASIIAADRENAVTYSYADEELKATAVFSTDEVIPEGAELVVNYVDPESEEYAKLSGRATALLDREYIYDVTTCSFYDYALVSDNVDVTPKTGLVDLQILFLNNTIDHTSDVVFAGRFERTPDETEGLMPLSADGSGAEEELASNSTRDEEQLSTEVTLNSKEVFRDELISINSDDSPVAELADGIIMSFSLKGNDLAESDSIVGILAGAVDEDARAEAADTDAEVPSEDVSQEETGVDNVLDKDMEEVVAAPDVKSLKASGSDYTVTLVYDDISGIPEGAALKVSEITQDSKEYQIYLEEAQKAMGLTEKENIPQLAARFFDIKIMVGDQEFTPDAGVSVEITYSEPLADDPDAEVSAVHFADEASEAEVLEANTSEIKDNGKATVEFTAETFSVYGVIYTADFHWEVDGKVYSFSIPGGGFVSFEHLVEALGIAGSTGDGKNGEEKAEDGPAGDTGSVESDAHTFDAYGEAISLNEARVSDAAKQFAADVEKIQCSDPELIWAGRVEEDTTVGALKTVYELEVQYSAELTEEQIGKINAQEVEAGDWALISVRPFTSEESLTVTMKNGNTFTVRLTDAQQVTSDDPSVIDVNSTYIICYVDGSGDYHVLKTNGEQETISRSVAEANNYKKFDQLDNNYRWTFYYVFKEKDREGTMDYVYYFIRPFADKSVSIALNDTGEPLVQRGTNNAAVLPQYADPDDPDSFQGFMLTGYGASLSWSAADGFYGGDGSLIKIFKQDPLPTYEFTVLSNDEAEGRVNVQGKQEMTRQVEVEVEDHEGNISTEMRTIHYYIAETNTSKRNGQDITATPTNSAKYVFSHWELNGKKVYRTPDGRFLLEGDETEGLNLFTNRQINTNVLPIPYNSSELRACFKINPTYEPEPGEDLGRVVDKKSLTRWLNDLKSREFPLNSDATDKTSEVYDYENRIYRVDLTSRASLATFAGTIDLGFIIDVSSSMDFPSYLYNAADDNNSSDPAKRENLSGANYNGEWNVGSFNDRSWYGDSTQGERWGFKTNRTYYLISKGTADEPDNSATVFMLKYDNGTWKTCDASKAWNNDNAKSASNDNNKYKAGYSYVIKKAGDLDANNNPRTRSYYLEKSLNTTLDELNTILSILSIADTRRSANPDVQVAWNSFNNYLPNVMTTDRGRSLQHTFRSVRDNKISLNYDHDNTYGGGTSTDIALLDAAGYMRNDVLSNWQTYRDNNGLHVYNQWNYSAGNYNRVYDGNRVQKDYYSFEKDKVGNGTVGWYNTWYASRYNANIGYTQNYANGFGWNNNHTKYAVLITDGAPQRGGIDVDARYVKEAAELLESRGVKLITVGLSMDAVPVGSQILYDIASKSSVDGLPLYYTATTGNELEYVLYEILQLIMEDAVVYGDVTDPVGEAFYPVDKVTGRPLSAGNVIDLKGNYIAPNESLLTAAQRENGYGVVNTTDPSGGNTGEYTIKWVNQPISVEGWHGSVYVKAKEDLLGGNGVSTNGGNASFTAHSYTVGNQSEVQIIEERDPIIDGEGNVIGPYTKEVTKESPKVNVNELTFSNNASSWNVYLGENVDPKDELRRLFEELEVEEVVTDGADTNNDDIPDVMSQAGHPTYNIDANSFNDNREKAVPDQEIPASGPYYLEEHATFSLEALIKDLIRDAITTSDDSRPDWSSFLSDDGLDWDHLIEEALEEGGVRIPYHKYGIADDSSVTITLRKEIADGEEWDIAGKSPHDTTVLSDEPTVVQGVRHYDPVERYTLTVLYSPDYDTSLPKGQGGTGTSDMHTGTYGTLYQGHAAGTEEARSIHEISTFERMLSLVKTLMGNDDVKLEGVKFRITDEEGDIVRPHSEYAVGEDTVYKKVSENIEGAVNLVQNPDSSLTGWYLAFDSDRYRVKDNKCYKKVESGTPGAIELEKNSGNWYVELTDTAYTHVGASVYKRVSDTVDGVDQGVNDPGQALDGWYLILPDPLYATDPDGRIYKKAADENVSGAIELIKDSGDWYVLYDDVDYVTDSDGLISISNLRGGRTYYLSESETLRGYMLLPEPLKIMVESEGVFTTLAGDEVTSDSQDYDPDTGRPVTAYNWDQEYKLNGDENAHIVITKSDGTTLSEYFVEYEEDGTVVLNKYIIRNNPGVELPATGGPGTKLFYLLGVMMTGLACAILLSRKRKKAS